MSRRFWLVCFALMIITVTATACTAKPVAAGSGVAVLVVDDFDGQPGAPPPSNQPPQTLDCAYTGEATQDVGSKGASGGSLPNGVAHGTVVFDELRTALNQKPTLRPVATTQASYPAYGLDPTYVHDLSAWTSGGTEVALVGVDVAKYETGQLTTELDAVVSSMRKSQHAFAHFVINMSFVVAPCDVQPYVSGAADLVDAYEMLIDSQPDLDQFRQVLDSLTQTAGSPQEMRNRLMTSPDLLPLTHTLTDPNAFATLPESVRLRLYYGLFEQGGRLNLASDDFPRVPFRQLVNDPLNGWLDDHKSYVIPVAAAGNGLGYVPATDPAVTAGDGEVVKIRLDFPFAPAIWDSVVSVSASEPDPHAASADPRARYSNGGEVMLDGRYSYQGTDVRGTSFAAPRLSYLEALYLLGGGALPCGQAVPPLGYSTMDEWDNLRVTDAAQKSGCVGFPPP